MRNRKGPLTAIGLIKLVQHFGVTGRSCKFRRTMFKEGTFAAKIEALASDSAAVISNAREAVRHLGLPLSLVR